MIIYHETNPDMLNAILTKGLEQSSRSEMGSEDIIAKTNQLLDKYRPEPLLKAGMSRDTNIYGYLTTNDGIVDISTGNQVSESEKVAANRHVLLRLDVTSTRCYVSDLDAYDKLKQTLEDNKNASLVTNLAIHYWSKLIRLDRYKLGEIARPEVMITYDIPPHHIKVVSS